MPIHTSLRAQRSHPESFRGEILDCFVARAPRNDEGTVREAQLRRFAFAAKGGIRPADRFEFELEDPVLKRTIKHGYDVVTLPVRG